LRPKLEKSLLCPACGVVMADALVPRWPGSLLESLVVSTPEGHRLQPMGVGVQVRIAQREVADAASARQRDEAEARVKYLKRNVSELVYDLRCRHGHRLLRTVPQIVRAMRDSPGAWVRLD
jgi:hypothetical protein